MSLQGMMSSLVWMRPVGGAVPQLLINIKKNCNSRFFRDKRQPYNSIMKRQTVRILNFPEWLAVFLSLLSGGCESCWETPAGVRAASRALPGVMVQIYLYKNQWVAKLKRGCRGEETIRKTNCPFNAQWRILSTSQRSDAFNHSLEFFLLLFVVPSGQQPEFHPGLSCHVYLVNTPELVQQLFHLLSLNWAIQAPSVYRTLCEHAGVLLF